MYKTGQDFIYGFGKADLYFFFFTVPIFTKLKLAGLFFFFARNFVTEFK